MNIIVYPNCKINIGLRIIEKREDGFHNLETLFVPYNTNDILEIVESNYLDINYYGLNFDKAHEDICIKAYKLLKKDFDIPPVSFHLYKKIPVGSGLGGGSSDGASTLLGLNSLFSLNLSTDSLLEYATKLGSDCPFFIYNKPMYGEGRGELLSPVNYQHIQGLVNGTYRIEINTPNIPISTEEAYSYIKPYKSKNHLIELLKSPIEEWKETIVNDFEAPLFEKHHELKEIKKDFYRNGAIYSSLSGSGSAIYAIFKK
jgi:4-diphosphocytidyl-2-C-methyl-D-erythritol kinase